MYKDIKLFIIDDEPELLQEVLPEYGFNVSIVTDGKTALDLLDEMREKFNVILLDILLPQVNGWDVLKNIRQNTLYCHTPVIVTTSLSSEIDLVSTLKLGADDYLTKPFNISTLVAKIESLLRRASWNNINNEKPQKEKELLTEREKEILLLLYQGNSNKKIAENLVLSELTVKTHLKNIFKKLNAINRTQAILIALDKKLIMKTSINA